MARIIKEAHWCNWPNQEYARNLEDLARMGARCDAWRKFFSSGTLRRLSRLEGTVIWFNRYEAFDKLLVECNCTEKQLRSAIKKMLLPDFKSHVYEFKRQDIYDAISWAKIPLNLFVTGLEECAQRDGLEHWQYEILARNEVPLVQIGIKLPWTVSRNCFSIVDRVRDGRKITVMICNHPDIDPRFNGKRWVAEGEFSPGTPKSQKMETLFAKVEVECLKHQVTIEG